MSRRGRKPDKAHRTESGRKSESKAARIDVDDGVVAAQPHRRAFAGVLGGNAARSQMAETALGRLRLIGQAEDRLGIETVRKKLFPNRVANGSSNGISDDELMGAQAYAAAVGRERWVRAAPKDKPSAIAFMVARGIDLSARELDDAQARYYIETFEECRAALMAATCSLDMQRVLRQLRAKVDKMRRGSVEAEAGDALRLMRGLGALALPSKSAAIKRAVDLIVIDDRDPTAEELVMARPGLLALAEMQGGNASRARQARMRSFSDRPTDWSAPASGIIERPEGGWKGRHRPLSTTG